MAYITMAEQFAVDARKYLRRADGYRLRGNEQNANGCERKALRKLEKGFVFTHWWLKRHG